MEATIADLAAALAATPCVHASFCISTTQERSHPSSTAYMPRLQMHVCSEIRLHTKGNAALSSVVAAHRAHPSQSTATM
jgi:hypothetical protein